VPVDGPAHGTLALNGDGSFTYTPEANFHGSDGFTYKANDGQADSGTATVSITVASANDTPAAADDVYSTVEGVQLGVAAPGVLANDGDADLDGLSAALVSGPAHGTLVLQSDGSFTYDAAAGFRGDDTFVYRSDDGQGGSDEATVTITVSAQADVGVSVTDSPDPATPAAPITYAVVVSNTGPSSASGVTVTQAVSAGGLIVAATASQGSCVTHGPKASCTLGTLGRDSTATVAVRVLTTGPGQLVFAATVTGVEPDPSASNNTAQETTDVGRLAAAPRPLRSWIAVGGGTATAALHLRNHTPSDVSYQLMEADPLPWLALSPDSGTIAAGATQSVVATFDATGLAPGLRRGRVEIGEDSPFAVADVPACLTVGFADVPQVSFGEPYIHALAGAGVTAGCGSGSFCPQVPLSRAAAAVWLLKSLEGATYEPPPATGTVFTDVPASALEAAYIEELAQRGVTAGCDGARYCPEAPVSRAEIAVFLLQTLESAGYVPPPAIGMFADLPPSSPFAAWAEEQARRGITAGCGGGNYCPAAPVSRSQSAIFMVATFGLTKCP
jgi:uncharacterized repeat protein (TIGR01451 family)